MKNSNTFNHSQHNRYLEVHLIILSLICWENSILPCFEVTLGIKVVVGVQEFIILQKKKGDFSTIQKNNRITRIYLQKISSL